MVGAEFALTAFEPSDFEVYHLDVFVDLCGANFCKNQTFPEITVSQEDELFRKVATLGRGYTQFFYKRQSGLVTSCVSKKFTIFDKFCLLDLEN